MRKLSPKTIIKLTRFFYSKIIPHLPKTSNRGRPRTYPDWQIIAMLIIKEVHRLSFRETIQLSKGYFKNVPSLRDFHYKAAKLKDTIQILIKFIHDYLQKDTVEVIIVDGTGIGFRKKTNLNERDSGKESQISHEMRGAEIKMLKKILQNMKKFLADRLYWLREYLERRGIRALIRVRRHGYDVDDEEYKQRDEIEGLFGNVKGRLGGYGLQ